VVSNQGLTDLLVSSTTLTGTHWNEFTITSGGGAFTLAPSQSRDIEVDFHPSTEGLKNGILRISSNDPNTEQFDVELFGTGKGGILGDVNEDLTANSMDALIVLACDIGIDVSQFCPIDCGDVNGDGFVDSSDAQLIISHDVDIDIPFPIGEPGCAVDVEPCSGCSP